MGTQAKRRDVAKERFWREVVRRQAKSGKSVRVFCGDEELTESGFYFWRAELRRRRQERAATRARKAKADEAATSAFVPVTITGPPAMMETGQARIELALPSGAVLRLPRDGEVSAVAALVAELDQTDRVQRSDRSSRSTDRITLIFAISASYSSGGST